MDPFADGLLPVCIGRATLVVRYMDTYDKEYRVLVTFGRATDTQDLSGQTVFSHELTDAERQDMLDSDFAALRLAVRNLTGERGQTPPMYSAVKVDGRPLYAYARKGEVIERKSRLIRIYSAALEEIRLAGQLQAVLRIHCSKGTYIRSLADDLGRALGFGAHAESLTRLACGPFRLDGAQEPDALFARKQACADPADFWRQLADEGILLPADSALSHMPNLMLDDDQACRLAAGQPLTLPADMAGLPAEPASPVVFRSRSGLLAVGRLETELPDRYRVRTERVLNDLADFRQTGHLPA